MYNESTYILNLEDSNKEVSMSHSALEGDGDVGIGLGVTVGPVLAALNLRGEKNGCKVEGERQNNV